MQTGNIMLRRLPEWYIAEKDTEKIVKKLSSVRELEYYLKNPDEYIRRISVLRLGELKLKESVNILTEIMDDRFESQSNRDLAVWIIKWNTDTFISEILSGKYSGKETYTDICRISIHDSLPSIRLGLSSSLINSELQSDSNETRSSRDIQFDARFCFHDWYEVFSHHFFNYIKSLLAATPKAIFSLSKVLYSCSLKKLPRFIAFCFSKAFAVIFGRSRARAKPRENYPSIYESKSRPLSVISKAAAAILCAFFYPMRLTLRHKKFTVCTLIALYFILTFSAFGKVITYNYFGMDLIQIQSDAYSATKQIFQFAWDEFKGITGNKNIPDTASYPQQTEDSTKSVQDEQFVVTAKGGLNLRKLPDSSSGKVLDKILAYGTTVKYLQKSQDDSSGRLWYYIETPDGKTGWAYSKWLKDMGGQKK